MSRLDRVPLVLLCAVSTAMAAEPQSSYVEKSAEDIRAEIAAAALGADADVGGARTTAPLEGGDLSVEDPSYALLAADKRFSIPVKTAFANLDSSGARGPRVFYGFAISALPNVVSILGNVKGMSADSFVCTGVLIDKDIVLTAAHCLCGGSKREKPVELRKVMFQEGGKASPMVSREIAAVGSAPKFGVSQSHFCPDEDYNVYGVADLAVLKMATEAPCQKDDDRCSIKPARLGKAEEVRPTTTKKKEGHYVVGYGLVDPDTARALGLGEDKPALPSERYAGKVFVASADCAGGLPEHGKPDKEYYGCVPDREIVAGKFTGLSRTDACKGDSGGPLFEGDASNLSVTDATPGDEVVGIVSRRVGGDSKTGKCGSGTLYARLDARNRSWIEECKSLLRAAKACPPII